MRTAEESATNTGGGGNNLALVTEVSIQPAGERGRPYIAHMCTVFLRGMDLGRFNNNLVL